VNPQAGGEAIGLGDPSSAKVLVVTGLTGSGKSTVCKWLAGRGAFVLDADRIGHEVLTQAPIIEKLARAFSPQLLDVSGEIDRKRLGKLVFAEEEALKKLGQIVHPPLVKLLRERIETLRKSRAIELIVVDAALHFIFEPRIACDAVLMTIAGEDELRRRIMERDHLSPSEALERLARQSEILRHQQEADILLDTTASSGRVRREMLLRVDARLGLHLSRSDFPPSRPSVEDREE